MYFDTGIISLEPFLMDFSFPFLYKKRNQRQSNHHHEQSVYVRCDENDVRKSRIMMMEKKGKS